MAGPPLPEQPEYLFVRFRAMFNGIYTVLEGYPDTLRAFHMGGNGQTESVSFGASGTNQLRPHF